MVIELSEDESLIGGSGWAGSVAAMIEISPVSGPSSTSFVAETLYL
jgi:hypothetical protein